jgi:hypothetical protein
LLTAELSDAPVELNRDKEVPLGEEEEEVLGKGHLEEDSLCVCVCVPLCVGGETFLEDGGEWDGNVHIHVHITVHV